jgi:hypothetical protein
MAIKVSSGRGSELERIVAEIGQPDVRVVFYFFSPELESLHIESALARAFGGARRVGASMIGGWSSAGPVEKGIVAMSLSGEEVVESYAAFREGAKTDPVGLAAGLASDLKARLGGRIPDPERYVGILLVDGLCLGERIVHELTMERGLLMPIIGGAAADELAFKRTLVACDERVSADGALLLALKLRAPFYYDHFVHYRPGQASCVVTKAEPERRVVWEIDGRPAAGRYAELLGLRSAADLKHTHFARNPLGVVIGDTVYARSPNAVVDGTGLQFYCFIEAGTKVSVLKQGDIIANAREAMDKASRALPGGVRGALLFNCVLRDLEMKEDGKVAAFNSAFGGMPFIGFNTYGEELFTHHNQTLTALFFGEEGRR